MLIVPPLLALAGALWMSAATRYFQMQTGRAFYGLAGNHASAPEWGFEYHSNGKDIERWTVSVPPTAAFVALIASALTFMIALRRRGLWVIAFVWIYHAGVSTALALLAAWYWVNVMGVFI